MRPPAWLHIVAILSSYTSLVVAQSTPLLSPRVIPLSTPFPSMILGTPSCGADGSIYVRSIEDPDRILGVTVKGETIPSIIIPPTMRVAAFVAGDHKVYVLENSKPAGATDIAIYGETGVLLKTVTLELPKTLKAFAGYKLAVLDSGVYVVVGVARDVETTSDHPEAEVFNSSGKHLSTVYMEDQTLPSGKQILRFGNMTQSDSTHVPSIRVASDGLYAYVLRTGPSLQLLAINGSGKVASFVTLASPGGEYSPVRLIVSGKYGIVEFAGAIASGQSKFVFINYEISTGKALQTVDESTFERVGELVCSSDLGIVTFASEDRLLQYVLH